MFSRFDRPDIRKNLFNKFLNKRKPVVDKEEEEEEDDDETTPIEPGIDYKIIPFLKIMAHFICNVVLFVKRLIVNLKTADRQFKNS